MKKIILENVLFAELIFECRALREGTQFKSTINFGDRRTFSFRMKYRSRVMKYNRNDQFVCLRSLSKIPQLRNIDDRGTKLEHLSRRTPVSFMLLVLDRGDDRRGFRKTWQPGTQYQITAVLLIFSGSACTRAIEIAARSSGGDAIRYR